jgi:alkylation response protein AidB-like acyl-CoA dehydrogenase
VQLRYDSSQRDLAVALRAELAGAEADRGHACLADLGAYGVEVPADRGGLALGLSTAVVICEELGRGGLDDQYRAAALVAELRPDLAPDIAAGRLIVRFSQTGGLVSRAPGTQDWVSVGAEPQLDGITGPTPTLARAWVRQSAYLLGLAVGAHRLAVLRAARRQQFGQAIGENQAISFPLAEQFAHLEATRLLVHRAAWLDDRGENAGLAATWALAYAAEQALQTTAWALHVHGAFGLTRYAPVHRHYELAAREALRWGSPARLWLHADRLAQRSRDDDSKVASASASASGPRQCR